MSNIRSRLDKIKNFVESDSLYNQQSLGGELNFHIFAYEPSDELGRLNTILELELQEPLVSVICII